MELSRISGSVVAVTEKNWSLRFGEPERDRFTLQCAEDLFLVSGCCSINGLSEQSALPSRIRPHVSGDEKEFSFDSKTVIPFGSEPSVVRKYKLTDHILQITTDLVMRVNPGMTDLSAGDFQVRGNITGIKVLGTDGVLYEAGKDPVIYESPAPPLSILFQSASGACLEISTGEDVWRWNGAERLGGTSLFRICRDEIGIRYTRELFHWEKNQDTPPPPGRTWRYNTIISWNHTQPVRPRRPAKTAAAFDCAAFSGTKGLCKESGELCLAANGTVNLLKKWLRSNLASLKKGDILLLDNVKISPCHDAAHQDRPGKKELIHWDLRAILEFKRWAEKQLARSGAVLKIIPAKDCVIRDFPSILTR